MMVTTRTRLAQPKNTLRPRCLAVGCRMGQNIGGLCFTHRDAVSLDAAADLAQVGVVLDSPPVVSVSPGLYLQITNTRPPVLVHRAVMEATLGRQLRFGENIHHINGCRFDNHPDNLELWVVSQPAGQRSAQLVTHARRILAAYGNDAEREAYARWL